MNSAKRIEENELDLLLLSSEQISKIVANAWFYAMASDGFKSYLDKIKPAVIKKGEQLKKSMYSTEFLILVLKGSIVKTSESILLATTEPMTDGKSFFCNSAEANLFTAASDSLIFEIPMDRSHSSSFSSEPPDLNVLRSLKIRPALKNFYSQYYHSEIAKTVAQHEIAKTVKIINVEKGKKLFLSNSSIYLVENGVVRSTKNNVDRKEGDLIIDFTNATSTAEDENFFASTNIRICEYAVNSTLIADALMGSAQRAQKQIKSVDELIFPNSLYDSRSSKFLPDEYLAKSMRNIDLNKLKRGPIGENYLNLALQNLMILIQNPAQGFNLDYSSVAKELSLTSLAEIVENKGFTARIRKFSYQFSKSSNQICIVIQRDRIYFLFEQIGEKCILFETTNGFFATSKKHLEPMDFYLEVERNQFGLLGLENVRTTYEKADFYGQKFFDNMISSYRDIFNNTITYKFFQTVIVLLIPTAIYGYLNQAMLENSTKMILSLSATMIVFLVFQSIAILGYNYYSAEASIQFKSSMMTFFHKIFLNHSQTPLKIGYVQTRMGLSDFSFSSIKYAKTELPIYLGLLLFYLVYIGKFAIEASAALIFVFAVSGGLVYFLRKKGGFSELNSTQLKQEMLDYYSEVSRSLVAISLFKKNDVFIDRLNSHARLLNIGSNQYSLGLGYLNTLGMALFKIGSLLVLYLVVLEMIHNKLGPMQIFGISLYLSYLSTPFQALANYMTNLNTSGLMNLPIQFLKMENLDSTRKNEIFRFNQSLLFTKVYFKPSDKSSFAMSDLNFKIKKGQKVAIIGRSGSGKTSLLKLISHALEYQHGQVQIDNVDTKLFDRQSISAAFAVCPQVPEILSEDIIASLLPQIHEHSFSEIETIWNAVSNVEFARIAKIKNFGISTQQMTTNPSLRKQLQLCKYIVDKNFKNADEILVFDEPTDFMDSEKENTFLNYLKSQFSNSTIIMTSTSIECAKWADRVLVLKGGRLVEDDEFYRLINLNGEFAELYRNQVGEQ